MTSQHPLRVGVIGLSPNASTSWASKAHLPPLITKHGKQLYTITALCNSSVENARKAIEVYNLPQDVKAYGSPKDLAADSEIDVVICSTRVDKHYETILPSVKAGKKVYVEWPIAANLKEVEELIQAAKKSGSEVAVGAQGQWAPPIAKVREIVESGKLGKVLNSNLNAVGGTVNRNTLPPGLEYFTEWKVGGNPITIGFGHVLDFTLSALGDFVPGTTSARTQIQWKTNDIVDREAAKVLKTVETNVPDLIAVHGELASTPSVVSGATYSLRFQRGEPFEGHPALLWHITCEKGEIQLKAMTGTALQAYDYKVPPTIHVQHFPDNTVEEIPWSWSEEQLEVPYPARSVMHCLYAFAESDASGWLSLEDAARRAQQIDFWVTKGKW